MNLLEVVVQNRQHLGNGVDLGPRAVAWLPHCLVKASPASVPAPEAKRAASSRPERADVVLTEVPRAFTVVGVGMRRHVHRSHCSGVDVSDLGEGR